MTIKDALSWARQALSSLPNPALEARLLLQHVLGKDAAFLISHPEGTLTNEQAQAFKKLIDRRKAHEPVSKIIGQREFYGRSFKINQHVLDPRPDSETLIEAVLKALPNRDQNLSLLELGVGSGCLILTLLAELPNARGVGVDISSEALVVADHNAKTLGVQDRLVLEKSDLFEAVTGRFDVILSNPPYIPTQDLETLEKDVRDFDPHLALDGGETGLTYYERILGVYKDYLYPGGFLALEMGEGQREAIETLVKESPSSLQVYKDLAQRERCLIVEKMS